VHEHKSQPSCGGIGGGGGGGGEMMKAKQCFDWD
jgi:hypothetical protein